jgi:isoprenylcysteine carboxyl methyltransferase (ICMT) family protein YpbQ
VAVALEVVGVALMAPAPALGLLVTSGLSYLLLRRVQIEEVALGRAAPAGSRRVRPGR